MYTNTTPLYAQGNRNDLTDYGNSAEVGRSCADLNFYNLVHIYGPKRLLENSIWNEMKNGKVGVNSNQTFSFFARAKPCRCPGTVLQLSCFLLFLPKPIGYMLFHVLPVMVFFHLQTFYHWCSKHAGLQCGTQPHFSVFQFNADSPLGRRPDHRYVAADAVKGEIWTYWALRHDNNNCIACVKFDG